LPDSAGPLGKLIYLPDSAELTGKLQTVREMNILLSVTTVKKNYIPPTGKIISLTVQNRQDISANTLSIFNRQKNNIFPVGIRFSLSTCNHQGKCISLSVLISLATLNHQKNIFSLSVPNR
jgi:hypothetical protein